MKHFSWMFALAALCFAGSAQAERIDYRYGGLDRSHHFSILQDEGAAATEDGEPFIEPATTGPGFGGASGGGFRITVDAGPATNSLDGFVQIDEVQIGGGINAGTRAEFDRNLGLSEEDSTRLGVKFQFGGFSLELAHQEMEFVTNELRTDVTIFGETFSVNSMDFTSRLDMPYYQLKLGFRLNEPDPDNGDWLAFGFGLGFHVFDTDFSVRGTANGNVDVDEQAGAPAPVPTLGLMLGIYPTTNISIEATAWALVVPEIEGVEATLLDFNVVGKYYITRYLSVGARLGLVTFELTATDVETDDYRLDGEFDITSTQISGVVGFSF